MEPEERPNGDAPPKASCPNCGRPVEEEDVVCPNCGEPLVGG